MPRKGSHPAYKPKREYRYTVKDIAELAGMTRKALSVAKFWGKVEFEDFKSVVSFLTRRIIDRRLREISLPLRGGLRKEAEGLGSSF